MKVDISDKKDEKDVILLSKQPIHPRDRLKDDAKNKEVTFVRQQPMHPIEIIKKMTKILEFDARTLKEIPYINIDVPIDTKESENEMTNRIIQNLRANNDSYYTEHEEGSNTFSIKEDLPQREKNRTSFNLF